MAATGNELIKNYSASGRYDLQHLVVMATSDRSKSGRTWLIPQRPWFMRMRWHDLLFMHWPVELEQIQNHLPNGLLLDTFDGQAWIGVVPFWMSGVAVRWTPDLPYFSRFPELNVRTYVTLDGKPGVWFFSLDATNPVAVRAARYLFHLPYMDARIKIEREADWIHYDCVRTHRGEAAANLKCSYRPTGETIEPAIGSLEHWLTARYCMYMSDRNSKIYRGEIDHQPWQLRNAEVEVHSNAMTNWLSVELPDSQPLCHFAKFTDVVAWGSKLTR